MSRNKPIGVFDSGLGGLTVVKELMKQLPDEDIVYFGDTAHVPYGNKSKEAIIRFSRENTRILLENDVKMVVVACNSSSSFALKDLRARFKLPIADVIAPGARRSVAMTQNGKVGVIATSATISGGQYEKHIARLDKKIRVFAKACPLFVPLVEEGWLSEGVTIDIARKYLQPLLKAKIDTLILGCTHYPLLKSALRKVAGPNVGLVDSAQEVAHDVKEVLKMNSLAQTRRRKPKYRFYVSDKPQVFERIAERFLRSDIVLKRWESNV